eukprot:tig00020806_g14049.t1
MFNWHASPKWWDWRASSYDSDTGSISALFTDEAAAAVDAFRRARASEPPNRHEEPACKSSERDRSRSCSRPRALDVAAGTGAMSFSLMKAGYDVVASDFSPDMVQALASRHSAAEIEPADHGHGHGRLLRTEVADAKDLGDLADGTFDVCTLAYAIFFFDAVERARVLRHLLRAVRPGGVLCVLSWREPGEVDTFLPAAITRACPQLAVRLGLHGQQNTNARDWTGSFVFSEPEEIKREATAAGWADVQVNITNRV